MKNINEEDDTLKIGYLKEHVLPLSARAVGRKKLSRFAQIESPDFVLLFIPITAFAMAPNEDTSLYNKDSKILLL
jgi:DNA recombination protein RmuC